MAFITPLPTPHRSTHHSSTLKTPLRPSQTLHPSNPHLSTRAPPPRMLVVEAKSTDDMDKILDSADTSLVVVDYSTTWCGPCKVIAPLFEELSEKYTDVVFVKVMGDANSDSTQLMQREGIRAVPAFHFWKSGSRVQTMTGAKSEELEKLIVSLK